MLLGFNRFNKLGDKLSDPVNIPAELNLERKKFYLAAYGVHLGESVGLNAQDYVHYKAYVKTSTGWAEIDDDKVKILSTEDEKKRRSNAYFCLYSTTDTTMAQVYHKTAEKPTVSPDQKP